MPVLPAQPRSKGAAPRCVANLAFAEILVIWALRRFANCRLPQESRSTAIAGEFSRAFGLASLEDALDAFAAMAGSLMTAARLPQAISVVEDDRINATEEASLSVLAAFQQREDAQARALGEWCLLPKGRERFLDGARRLARRLREAGHMIPYEAPARRALVLEGNRQEDSLLPFATDIAALEDAERGIVTAARLWVCAFRRNQDALAAARGHFDCQINKTGEAATRLWGDRRSGADAGLSLHAILRNTTLATTRQVDVRCPSCPGLSPDEARLLEAAAWLQRDQSEPARLALGDWLQAAALRLTMGSARGLARTLLAVEQCLPLREWDLAALTAAAHPPLQEATCDNGTVEPRPNSSLTIH